MANDLYDRAYNKSNSRIYTGMGGWRMNTIKEMIEHLIYLTEIEKGKSREEATRVVVDVDRGIVQTNNGDGG